MLPLLAPPCFSATLQPRFDIQTSEPHPARKPENWQRYVVAELPTLACQFVNRTLTTVQPCGQVFDGQNFRMGLCREDCCGCWCLHVLHVVLSVRFHWCPAALRCGTTADL